MSIVWTNFVLLPMAALVAVPLLLHLFARTRPPSYRFSSIEFILRIIRKTMRVRRPQDLLLLILRTLLFAAVIALFLQPLLCARGWLAGPARRRNVVIAVDASASMACIDGAQSRFAAACAQASELLGGLSSRDTANVIWMRASPRAVFPEMGVNFGFLQDALRRAKVTAEPGDIEGSLGMAAELLAGCEGKHEICVLSDFQESVWRNANVAVPPTADLALIKVGGGAAPNLALTRAHVAPARPLAGEEATIHCEVWNFSELPERNTVFLEAGESRQSQEIVVSARKAGVAVFKHRFAEAGPHSISVSMGEDSFPGDDRRWTALRVAPFFRVGLLADEPDTAACWKRVLDAVGWARVETLSADELAGGDLQYDALLLSGWDGAAPGAVKKRLSEGCAVVWQPARDMPAARLAGFIGAPRADSGAAAVWQESSRPFRTKVSDRGNPVFELFADGKFGDPARGTFLGRLNLSLPSEPAFRTLMSYDDGVFALAEYDFGGRLYLWNMPLGPRAGTWQKQPEFLVFLAELLLKSRTRAPRQNEASECLPGQSVSFEFDRRVLPDEVSLLDMGGKVLQVRALDGAGSGLASDPIADPGLYTWRMDDKLLGYSAVNFPQVESDLRTLRAEDVAKAGVLVVNEARRLRQLREGIELWPFLLAAGFLLALLEGAALLLFERT